MGAAGVVVTVGSSTVGETVEGLVGERVDQGSTVGDMLTTGALVAGLTGEQVGTG